ncbi:GspE/PulE family protein, partial [Dissulfuribacter thermophilus]|uniref:GspE/PulE family protein n=1 Tax=Dissulfuribacter thermophilus TaxID=1156395 RepID=UPI00137B0889
MFDNFNKIHRLDQKELLCLYHLEENECAFAKGILNDVRAFFRGEKEGFLPCEAPYSNFDHAIFTAQTAGRILDGLLKSGEFSIDSESRIAVFISSLLHDIGFLRRGEEERPLKEGALTFRHIQRGIDFVSSYLKSINADQPLISSVIFSIASTALYGDAPEFRPARPEDMIVSGIVSSADLLSQAAHPDILASLGHLWEELEAAYEYESREFLEKKGAPKFLSYQDLLLNILEFYDSVLAPRLEGAGGFHRFLEYHYGSKDHPYNEGINKNYEILTQNRTILLEVAKRLFTSRSFAELKMSAIPHLRRLFSANTILILTNINDILDSKEFKSGAYEDFRKDEAKKLFFLLRKNILLNTIEDLKKYYSFIPPELASLIYPILSKRSILIAPFEKRADRGPGAILLFSEEERHGFSRHTLSLVEDLGSDVIKAIYDIKLIVEERDRKDRLRQVLTGQGLIDQFCYDHALKTSFKLGVPITIVLNKEYGIDQRTVSKAISKVTGLEFITLTSHYPRGLKGDFRRLNPKFLKKHFVVPISSEGDEVQIAVSDPITQDISSLLTGLFPHRKLKIKIALPSEILRFIESCFEGGGKEELLRPSELESIRAVSEPDSDTNFPIHDGTEQVSSEDNIVVRLAQKILLDALRLGASDIHVEFQPVRQRGRVRFRIDGQMRPQLSIKKKYFRPLVARYKIISGLDIAEKRIAQDGRLRFRYKGMPVDVRIVTLPRGDGFEDVVLRILKREAVIGLDDLMLSEKNLALWKKLLKKTSGLIIVSGPTGSGKTTTIHASIEFIKKDSTLKIWAAEDPVEIVQDGISQIQIQPSRAFGFSEALKAFLRADPDVIFVGEIRDPETAKTAVRAALTGHLVLSTLHTGSALEALVRLSHMGVTGLDLSEALLCVMAQKLFRRLCPACARTGIHDMEDIEKEWMGKFSYRPKTISKRSQSGCKECNYLGYKERVAIQELLEIKEEIRPFIRDLDIESIRTWLKQASWPTMIEDGLKKMEM